MNVWRARCDAPSRGEPIGARLVDPRSRKPRYRQPFLDIVDGALSKQLLLRDDDVQVLHGFRSVESASAYLGHELFAGDIVGELAPLLASPPEIRVYDEA